MKFEIHWIIEQFEKMKPYGLDLSHRTINNETVSGYCTYCEKLRQKYNSSYLDCRKHADLLSLSTKSSNFKVYESQFNILIVKDPASVYKLFYLKNKFIFSFEFDSLEEFEFVKDEMVKIKYHLSKNFRKQIHELERANTIKLNKIEDYEDFIRDFIVFKEIQIEVDHLLSFQYLYPSQLWNFLIQGQDNIHTIYPFVDVVIGDIKNE